ncbi:MAG TPA: hypothetical protein EYQ50_15320 [Verrucomicrobiales bacterium]|nr:hypothetical protein [Verrucomicrobiales bacterium]
MLRAKKYFLCEAFAFAVLFIPILGVNADVEVHENLSNLAFSVGEWVAEIEVESTAYRFEISIQPAAAGHILKGDLKVFAGSDLISQSTEIFYFKPESKKISAISFNSSGRRFEGDFKKQGGKFVRKWVGIDENGKKISGENHLEKIDRNSMIFRMTNIHRGRTKLPDQPVLKVRRIHPR